MKKDIFEQGTQNIESRKFYHGSATKIPVNREILVAAEGFGPPTKGL